MAPAGSWISFALPHQTDMLLRPCSQYDAHPVSFPLLAPPYTPNGDAASYQYYFFPQAPKLEDLLGSYQPSMLEPCAEAQESSSLSTAHHHPPPPPLPPPPPPAVAALRANSASSEVDDSASATGNDTSLTPEAGTEFALSAVPLPLAPAAPPRPGEKVGASVASAASQRTSVYRGVTRW